MLFFTLAVGAVSSPQVGPVAQFNKGIFLLGGQQDHVTAASTITPIGSPMRDIFFPSESNGSVSSPAPLYIDLYPINKQAISPYLKKIPGNPGLFCWVNIDHFFSFAKALKRNQPVNQGKKSVVFSYANIITGMNPCTSLAYNNTAGSNLWPCLLTPSLLALLSRPFLELPTPFL